MSGSPFPTLPFPMYTEALHVCLPLRGYYDSIAIIQTPIIVCLSPYWYIYIYWLADIIYFIIYLRITLQLYLSHDDFLFYLFCVYINMWLPYTLFPMLFLHIILNDDGMGGTWITQRTFLTSSHPLPHFTPPQPSPSILTGPNHFPFRKSRIISLLPRLNKTLGTQQSRSDTVHVDFVLQLHIITLQTQSLTATISQADGLVHIII